MLVMLGVFLAGLAILLVLPHYGRRAARLATEALRRSMPLTEAEIRADKDRLRAEHAIATHKLEMKLEEASLSAARQLVEINRRDAAISEIEGEVARMRTVIEESENARRVLEQTITDRLPRVEQRLTDAKKLLFQRDREIATLSQSAAKQQHALEEATQINTQQRDEIHRLNATLTTRAARNREKVAASDARFDEEVALRAELEALRAKSRDQAALISRLQEVQAKSRGDGAAQAATNGTALSNAAARMGDVPDSETARLKNDLVEAEIALKSARAAAEAGQAGQAALDAEVRRLRSEIQDRAAEVANLKAALKAYEAEDADSAAIKDSKIALKARLSALSAQSDQQQATIHSLRAEIAAANEKLARQAKHFVEEMRRLGAGTMPASGAPRRSEPDAVKKRSLAERIAAPRPEPRTETTRPHQDAARVTGFLRALDGSPSEVGTDKGAAVSGSATAPASGSSASAEPAKGRARPGLIERLTGVDKPAASGG